MSARGTGAAAGRRRGVAADRWRRLLRSSVCSLLCGAPLVQAESLEDAWALALASNHALGAVQSRAEAARADEQAARAERWPKLTLEGSYQRFQDAPAFQFPFDAGSGPATFTSPEIVRGDDFYTGRARVDLPLFTAGRLGAGIAAAEASATAAGLASDSAAADLKLAVAQAYVEVLRAGRALQAADARVASLAAFAADVAVMVEQESVARTDLLAARVTLADAEQARLRARNRRDLARAAYNRLLGEPLDREPALEDPPAFAALPSGSLEELVAQSLDSRRELAGVTARSRSLEERARSERAQAWPQVGALAEYQYLENQVLDREDFALVGVGVTWTLFDAGRIRRRADSLAGAGRAAARERDELRSLIELEVREAWLNAAEARARVPVTREAVAEADENLRSSRELYGVGLATHTQVLGAEALRLTAVTNRDNAVLDAALAELTLRRAVGAL